MKINKQFIGIFIISLVALVTVIKADETVAPTESLSPDLVDVAEDIEDDAEMKELEEGMKGDSIEEEWNSVLKSQFSDQNATHDKTKILNLAYQHLIYEDLETLGGLKEKHERKEKLNDEEAASLSNAYVAKSYIDMKFGDKEQVTNDEAVEILNSDKYDAWMDDMPDSVINMLDEFMPDEDSESENDL